MKVREITVHNFKSIAKDCLLRIDNNVTVLVGASQSGKTNILRAIEKFSIGNYQPDDICDFSPAGGGAPLDPNMPMITVIFDIEEVDKEALGQISPNLSVISELEVARKYNGDYDINPSSSELTDTEIARLTEIGEEMGRVTEELVSFLNKWQGEWEDIDNELNEASNKLATFKAAITSSTQIRNPTELPNLLEELEPAKEAFNNLFAVLVETEQEPGQETKETTETENRGVEDIEQARRLIADVESLASQPSEIAVLSRDSIPNLINLLPTFIYVSSEHDNLLRGQINLDELEAAPDDPKFTSTQHLIKLAGLNLTALQTMDELPQLNLLTNASRRVTKVLQKIWQQQKIEVEISLKGPNQRQLSIYVRSNGRPSRFPEHQGSGFRWYLEFYLSYALTAGKELKHDVLLIDEAGIHLHPYAQRNLVERLNEIAEHNQVIHATHLPDMLDIENPERWRVVIHEVGSDAGTQIINEAYQPREENIGFEVVTKALWGSVIVPAITLGPRNFIVEGASDMIYLHTLSRILAKDDPNIALLVTGEVSTFPAHGVHRYQALLTFCNRPGFNTVVLFDSDQDGKRVKKKLIDDDMLSTDKAIELNDVYTSPTEERDIESIFGFTLLKEAAMSVYQDNLPIGFNFKSSDLPPKGGLGKKFKVFFQNNGIEWYDTTQVAEALKKIISQEPNKLTKDSRERFAALLGKVRDAFQGQVLSDIKTEISPK